MYSINETEKQKQIADYYVYLQLKDLKYSNVDIAKHISYSKEQFEELISNYSFKNGIRYKLQEQEGNYLFNGIFYITKGVQNLLSKDEIKEIYLFIQDLVRQHGSIDYLQVFFHNNHKLFFIDQLDKKTINSKEYNRDDNYCILMLAGEY